MIYLIQIIQKRGQSMEENDNREQLNSQENLTKDDKPNKACLITALIFAVGIPLILSIPAIITGATFIIIFIMISFLVGVGIFVFGCCSRGALARMKLSVYSLAFELITVPLFIIGAYAFMFGGFIFILLAVGCPFIGFILGIITLCSDRKLLGKAGVAVAIVAVVLPVVCVLAAILLLSTGVFVIRFM